MQPCELIDFESALGGRTLVKLKIPTGSAISGDIHPSSFSSSSSSSNKNNNLNKLKPLRLSVGESIQLRKISSTTTATTTNSSSTTTSSATSNETEPIRGIVQIVADKSLSVSMDDFKEDWNQGKLLLSRVPNQITFKRYESALEDLQTGNYRIPKKIIDICFATDSCNPEVKP